MNDKPKILGGLIVFIFLITSPIWYNMASGKVKQIPKPELSKKAKMAKECVMPTPYMKARHMDLLNHWRDKVVRDGERIHISPKASEYKEKMNKNYQGGKKYVISLQNTCLNCHDNKDKFCDACHKYSGVDNPKTICWSCHLEPTKKKSHGGNE